MNDHALNSMYPNILQAPLPYVSSLKFPKLFLSLYFFI